MKLSGLFEYKWFQTFVWSLNVLNIIGSEVNPYFFGLVRWSRDV